MENEDIRSGYRGEEVALPIPLLTKGKEKEKKEAFA